MPPVVGAFYSRAAARHAAKDGLAYGRRFNTVQTSDLALAILRGARGAPTWLPRSSARGGAKVVALDYDPVMLGTVWRQDQARFLSRKGAVPARVEICLSSFRK
jgi:hypothetical protein